MECPYCHKPLTEITNSRPTKENAQIWRRRKCLNCGEIFTTHEIIDLSHLTVIKKSGKAERFSHAKLFSGIYNACVGYRGEGRKRLVDKITREIKKDILYLKKKRITSEEIGEIVLRRLCVSQSGTFLRFLAYNKEITSEAQMKRELSQYLKEKVLASNPQGG